MFIVISIHALRVEGDAYPGTKCVNKLYFYPRPPGGGRRLRAANSLTDQFDFYPRPPGGGRHVQEPAGFHVCRFLSTPSGWRATAKWGSKTWAVSQFLSTPSGWRATYSPFSSPPADPYFYPRPPGGGRQQKRTKFSSVFAKKGEEFASLRRGKRKICRWRFKKDKFWVLIWCEGSRKSVCALASHCG